MKFVDWEPHYIAILEYFGFEREADEAAAQAAADLAGGRDDLGLLQSLIQDRAGDGLVGTRPASLRKLDQVEGTGTRALMPLLK